MHFVKKLKPADGPETGSRVAVAVALLFVVAVAVALLFVVAVVGAL